MKEYIKKAVLTALIVLVTSFFITPLFHVGDTIINEPTVSKNYNGYFAIHDEDILIDYGYTYSNNYYHSIAQRYFAGYYKIYTYGQLVDKPQIYLSSVYVTWTYTLNSSMNYYAIGSTTNYVRLGVVASTNTVCWGTSETVLDSLNNYQIFVIIIGLSNYESE